MFENQPVTNINEFLLLLLFSGLEEEEVCLLMFLKSVSGLKKVCLQVSNLTDTLANQILSLIRACPSLTEFR